MSIFSKVKRELGLTKKRRTKKRKHSRRVKRAKNGRFKRR